MTSGTDPDLKAMTGVPQAMASIITKPKVQANHSENRSAAAPAETLAWHGRSLTRASAAQLVGNLEVRRHDPRR
jgi:hypothetical protein